MSYIPTNYGTHNTDPEPFINPLTTTLLPYSNPSHVVVKLIIYQKCRYNVQSQMTQIRIPFTTTIVITDGSAVKPYTCHHKTITRMSYNVMTLLHRALLQRPFFGRSKAPFLTNSVSHSISLQVRFRTGS